MPAKPKVIAGICGRGRRGSVLLMILVIIVVLSAMIVQFTEKGMAEIAAEGHYVERNRLRVTAYSALETAMAVLADVKAVDGGLTTPEQGWDDPLGVAGFPVEENVTVSVSYADESGKLPLNTLDEARLQLLFTEMGFAAEDVSKLTYALLDWVDADDEVHIDGAEDDIYELAEWPYAAANQPVRRLTELAVVDGFRDLFFDEAGQPNDYFRLLADTVSVHPVGALNANSVSEFALRSFVGIGDPQIEALRDYRAGADGAPGTADDRYFVDPAEIGNVLTGLPPDLQLGVEVSVLRVRVEVAEKGGGRFALEAVVQLGEAGAPEAAAAPPEPPLRRTGGRDRIAAEPSISYPFVFLELTEDVGQNQTIAAPGGETLLSARGRDGAART